MKYFLDTEFHEFNKCVMIGDSFDPSTTWVNTIELISIGIVNEKNDNYYAISKDFDVEEAWDNKWLRDNVLFPIYNELAAKRVEDRKLKVKDDMTFNLNWTTFLISFFGKSNEEIAKEIQEFVLNYSDKDINFYAYYADYDWVVFCWLFGRMIDLPKGFPMYCRDLKQEFDEKWPDGKMYLKNMDTSISVKSHFKYPKQKNEHNALDDAKWNLKLKRFIDSL